jgi:phosphoglycolate phosphatase-like HAD superfamily hydrolase
MIQHLIWDVDGTLFDTYPAIARSIHAALLDLGTSASLDWILTLSRVSLDHCFTMLTTTYAVPGEELEERFDQHYQRVTPADQPPFPGVVEVCSAIQARDGLNLIVTHRARAGLNRLLTIHQLTGYFSDIISNDDAYPRKPDPAAFVALIEKHHLPRAVTLGLGDRDIDVLAAQAAGLRAAFFGANCGTSAPDFVFTDYTAFLEKITHQGS